MLNKTAIMVRLAELGMRQTDLANKMGANPMQVSLWINNKRDPKLVNAAKMARVLNCKVDDLLVKDAA